MRKNSNILHVLMSTHVVRVVPGIGSFLNIYLKHSGQKDEFQIWLYLCDWALTVHGKEVISSDAGPDISVFDFASVINQSTVMIRAEALDDEEVHLIFSGDVVIEIWSNSTSYGAGAQMFFIFKNGEALASYESPLNLEKPVPIESD